VITLKVKDLKRCDENAIREVVTLMYSNKTAGMQKTIMKVSKQIKKGCSICSGASIE